MRAFQISDYGCDPKLVEVPKPAPSAGELLVRISAAGVNFADLLMIQGKYQERPHPPVTLGMEIAGIVERLGEGVTGFEVGQPVAVYGGQGGMAEWGCFPENRVVALPPHMPLDIAAGFLITYGTSYLALQRRARLMQDETLLILGAAGGVGLTAVEIGKAMGARVIASARGSEKLAIAKSAGADHLIDSDKDDLRDAVKALGGADVVYDAVGGDQFRAALRCTNPEGRILAIGFASGDVPQIPANHLLVKNVDVTGVNFGAYLSFNPKALAQSFTALFDLYTQGKLHPHISHRLPLEQAQDALDLLSNRTSTGKVILTV